MGMGQWEFDPIARRGREIVALGLLPLAAGAVTPLAEHAVAMTIVRQRQGRRRRTSTALEHRSSTKPME